MLTEVLSFPVGVSRADQLESGPPREDAPDLPRQQGLQEVEADSDLPLLSLVTSACPPHLPRARSDVDFHARRELVRVGVEGGSSDRFGAILEVSRRREGSTGSRRPEGCSIGPSWEGADGEDGGRVSDVEGGDRVSLGVEKVSGVLFCQVAIY